MKSLKRKGGSTTILVREKWHIRKKEEKVEKQVIQEKQLKRERLIKIFNFL